MKYPRLNLINRSFVIAWLGCLLACTSLFAAPLAPPAPQLKLIQRRTDQGTLHLYQMKVTPAAEPVPAFRYRLTVMPHETKPGNAVTRLLRCLGENTLTNIYKYTYDELGDDFDKLYTPSDQIPLDKLKAIDGKLDLLAEHFVKLAAYSREIDWGIEEEDFRGIETIGFLLPTAQETRDISRLLMIRARLQIAERRYDDAIETLKRNFRIAQTVSEMKFLVSGLIGIAEVGMGHRVIADLIAAEDSPNLYWALAELPTPMIDLRESLRMETSIFLRLFPSLMDVESKQLTPQEWAAEYRELFDYPGVISGLVPGDSSPAGLQYSQLAAVPLGIVNYPVAKRRLVEQAKMDPEVVQQMPVGQVLLVDTVREYQKLANEHEKSLYLPRREAAENIEKAETKLRQAQTSPNPSQLNPGQLFANLLLPASQQVLSAQLRTEWERRGLQVVEAIRMHLAQTGELPKSIEDITIVPVPVNPATGKKFVYWLDGETAIVDMPFSDGFRGTARRFEIQVAN